jgi:hypothetical protein
MKSRGENTHLIRKIILGNRNADRIYYNWILPRVYHLRYPQTWPALMNIIKSPCEAPVFFQVRKQQATSGTCGCSCQCQCRTFSGRE